VPCSGRTGTPYQRQKPADTKIVARRVRTLQEGSKNLSGRDASQRENAASGTAMSRLTPFTPAADFFRMASSESLGNSEVHDKTFVEVNEKGTEAANARIRASTPAMVSIQKGAGAIEVFSPDEQLDLQTSNTGEPSLVLAADFAL